MDRWRLLTRREWHAQTGWPLFGIWPVLIVLSIAFAVAIVYLEKGAALSVMAVILLTVALLTRLRLDALLSTIIFLLPFPVFVTIGDRDWGTVSTFSIYLIAVLWMFSQTLPSTRSQPEKASTIGAAKVPLLLLSVAYLIAIVNTPASLMPSALRNVASFGSSLLIFAMVATTIREERTLVRIVNLLSIAGLIQGLMALWVALFPDQTSWLQVFSSRDYEIAPAVTLEGTRVRTSINDYELLAEYFAILLPLQAYMVMRGDTLPTKLLHASAGILGLVGLLLTGTRGAVVALAIGLMIFLAIFRPRVLGWRSVAVVGSIGLLFFFFSDFLATRVSFVAPLLERLQSTQLIGLIPDTRLYVWGQTWGEISQQVWFGHGPYRVELVGLLDPHSLYLNYWYAIGAIGLFAFLWFFALVLNQARKVLRDPFVRSMSWGITAATSVSLIICAIDEIKITYLRQSYMHEFIWVMFGLVLAGAKLVTAKQKEQFLTQEGK